jgi:(1->4)-alpha-D-glucan 1-alpha-D-glucosylmutase
MNHHNNKPLEGSGKAARVPVATYRCQFNSGFTFQQAIALAEYLRDLGVSDLYASPLFQATPQSTHGYDICSFEQLNPALGDRSQFDHLAARLQELGLGLILDMVPNHMGNDPSNCWWSDVLARGEGSDYGLYFDIEWHPSQPDLQNKVLLPTLGEHYSAALEGGKLKLVPSAEGELYLAYGELRFPVALESYPRLLAEVADALAQEPQARGVVQEIRDALQQADGSWPERLAAWAQRSPPFKRALDELCTKYNGEPGKPRSFDKLHALIRQQHYRLACWQVGPEEINYRRFFDVTQLASLRMERPEVYEHAHRLVFELVRAGQLTGLRIDHPDGLWDPKEYFARLQRSYLATQSEAAPSVDWLAQELRRLEHHEEHRPVPSAAGHALPAPRNDPLSGKAPRVQWPFYVVVEKILTGGERLRRDWPVQGSTGYDFLNRLNGIFIDGRNEDAFTELYRRFTNNHLDFAETVYLGKKRVLALSLISELGALAYGAKRLASRTRYGQDFTYRELHSVLTEVIANFPVYRTYIDASTDQVVPVERYYIEQAVQLARKRIPHTPEVQPQAFDFIQDLLLLRAPPDLDEEGKRLARDFALRFQQLTGPVTAKGLEDTAFYNYNRLLSLNEVGGDAAQFGIPLAAFHEHNQLMAEQWPHTLLATATHDTKRGEDLRARLNVLSEVTGEWSAAVERWRKMNAARRSTVDEQPAPSDNDEYQLYQTLVGAWPQRSALDQREVRFHGLPRPGHAVHAQGHQGGKSPHHLDPAQQTV